jgi:hypothetical protein
MLKEIPARMKVSERSFFGYRSGAYPITPKAWRKLAAAEAAAGIGAVGDGAPAREEGAEVGCPGRAAPVSPPGDPPYVSRLMEEFAALRAEVAASREEVAALRSEIRRKD